MRQPPEMPQPEHAFCPQDFTQSGVTRRENDPFGSTKLECGNFFCCENTVFLVRPRCVAMIRSSESQSQTVAEDFLRPRVQAPALRTIWPATLAPVRNPRREQNARS